MDMSGGAQGVLLVGFSGEDAATLRSWFASIEPTFRVACCREEYLGRSMADLFDGQHGLLGGASQWQARSSHSRTMPSDPTPSCRCLKSSCVAEF